MTKNITIPQALDGVLFSETLSGSGIISVRETDDWRWLIFNNNAPKNTSDINHSNPLAIQSLMLKSDRSYLALPYMQAMLAALCFNPLSGPVSVLQLGLGAGAINRFAKHFLPQHLLTTVELEPLVVDIYQQFFLLENKNTKPSEKILVQSAVDYLSAAKKSSSDLILCDLYAGQGLPAFLLRPDFYRLANKVLSETGVLVINTGYRTETLLQSIADALRGSFKYLIVSEVVGFENIIIYASNIALDINQISCDALQANLDLNIGQHFLKAKRLSL